jgi:hypothetical protein
MLNDSATGVQLLDKANYALINTDYDKKKSLVQLFRFRTRKTVLRFEAS